MPTQDLLLLSNENESVSVTEMLEHSDNKQ